MRLGFITLSEKSAPNGIVVGLLINTLVSATLGTFFGFIVSSIPLNPIHKLISGMDELASGNYKKRLHLGNAVIAKEISRSFNTLAEELENTEMLRSDFINNFSHEFKTPIVSIAGFAKVLRKGNLNEKQRQEYLSVIEEESMRLSDMATNVLNLTNVENQAILTNISEFNLSEQLRICVLLLEEKWSRKELEFSLEFNEHTISGNEELLKQIWINLIDNAIKFSSEKSMVQIDITESGDTVSVTIANMGSTISEDDRKKIFNKFYQADKSHSSMGSGIGLAIVKRAVNLHSGDISVKSSGNMTAFTVTLPKYCEE